MIPILFDETETDFTHNGIGRLVDCISCKVTEERNGIYELEFKYPVSGKWFSELMNLGVVGVIHDDNHDIQPFDIYKSEAGIDGVVTFNAHHISYRLNNKVATDFQASTAKQAFTRLGNNILSPEPYNPFTFDTDKVLTAPFDNPYPQNVRNLLMGQEGSLLDTYGPGDYKFDKFDVMLYANRGSDTGVTVRFGKNMTGITRTRNEAGVFSAIVPYAVTDQLVPVTTAPNYIITPTVPVYPIVPVAMNFYDEVSQLSSWGATELAEAARAYLDKNKPWLGTDRIVVDFVALWQSPEYESVAAIQRVGLCDTVSVYYLDMGIVEEKTRVEKVVYDVLNERFDSIELGTIQKSFVAITNSRDTKNQGATPVQAIVNKVLSEIPGYGLQSSDDSAGNVTLSARGQLSSSTDGNGNVTIAG